MRKRLTLTPTESRVVRAVKKNGGKIWATGGCIRDLLIGLTPKDIDMVTDLRPEKIRHVIENAWMRVIPDNTAISHGIIRIASSEGIIDLASMRKDVACDGRHAETEFASDIYEDLARRDLTINAMAATIDEEGNIGEIIDPFSEGRTDIDKRRIRFVGKAQDRIQEDYLRIVRACRFTALGAGWELDQHDAKWIKEFAHKIPTVSEERIRDEVLKALSYCKPSHFFRSLQHCGGLELVARPISDCYGIEQNDYHAETVFEHLMLAVDASVDLTDNVLLRMAALFHDVGKPATKSEDDDGDIHFYKHEIQGMILTDNWMRQMKFSNKDRAYVTNLVKHHQWRFMPDSKDKTIRRWLREVGESWEDLILLRCADRKGNLAKAGKAMITGAMRNLIEKATSMIAKGEPIFDGDLAINGEDLKELGIKPGPVYKKIFADMWALVLNEPQRNTKDELTKLVKRKHVGDRP